MPGHKPVIECKFIDLDKTNIISNNGLSIIHINARSIINFLMT